MRWKLALVLAVTAISLGWVLWGLDLGNASRELAAFRPEVVGVVLVIFVVTLISRTLRFQLLVDHPVPFRSMLAVVAVGFLAINVVPLRMGELVRPYLLWESRGVPFGKAVAGVVLERLLDMVALLVLIAAVGFAVDLPEGGLRVGGVDLLATGTRVIGSMAALGVLGSVVVAIGGHPVVALLERMLAAVAPGLAARVAGLGLRFVDGVRALFLRPMRGLAALACTAVTWGGTLLAVWVTMQGFGMGLDIASASLNWASTMTAMALLPTPGFLGGFEAGSVASLALLGVGPDLARTFALVLHLQMFSFTVLSGGLFLLVEGWSLVALVRASRDEELADAPAGGV